MNDDSFNLKAPPRFRGLHPDAPVQVYHRHLPHWRQKGATYFVTFRLGDSIPQEQLLNLKRWRTNWEQSHPEPRSEKDWQALAREITGQTEKWMDEGRGSCVFENMKLAQAMQESLLHFQNVRCFTSCLTVMPNHVHAIMKPLHDFRLEDILGSIKRFVAGTVNRANKLSGSLWAEESYDRIVRDELHLFKVIQYIGRNANKAGIPREKWVRWIDPEWDSFGWGFRSED